MKFHTVHGSAISLTEGKSTATRSDAHFCNGIVFSDQPIKAGQKVCIQLSCTLNWSGALRIGFTSNDPSKVGAQDLPKYTVPYFSKKEGYWIRPISESLSGEGAQLMFYISTDGHAQFFVNNEHKGVLFTGLPADRALWVIFDIYGNTKSIKFVKSDDAPKEIKARGPEAIEAFESACQSGMRSVYKTRLMLVGQDRAGKTSLKKALLGQKYEATEEETSGIDLSTSCTFCVGSHGNWTVIGKDVPEKVEDPEKQGILGDVEALQEEYNQALATNIVQELLYQKRRKPSQSQKNKPTGSRESQRNSATGAKKMLTNKPPSATMMTKFNEIPIEMFREVPDRVVELVQKLLDIASDTKSQDSVSIVTKPVEGANMVLNIWDFAGKEVYYTTHQVFLTRRAVYVIVLDLTKDLQQDITSSESETGELSTLEFMDFWMHSIFAHASTTSNANPENTRYSPPILVVGTHRDSLDADQDLCNKAVEEKFAQIQDFLVGKPYVQHLVTPFFAVDNSLDDTKLTELRQKIEEVSCQESYIGERMPISWIRFELEINKLVSQGSNYASYDQVTEIAGNLGIHDYKEVMTMLEFYHDLGVIIFYGSGKSYIDNLLRNTVILKPQWLVDMFKHVVSPSSQPQDKWNLIRDKWTRLQEFGILEEVLLDTLWHEARDQKLVLLGLLEKFDLICQRLPSLSESQTGDYVNKSYYVPSRLNRYADSKKLYTMGENDVTFYIDLHGFLPGGLYQRILTRTVRWSQDHGGQNPYYLYKRVARFYLDTEHDFVLEMAANKYSRIKVVILRVSEPDTVEDNTDGEKRSPPNREACAKIRNFLESSLSELREMWMKRIAYTVCMRCPCESVCETHKREGCSEESCLHFLNLDECLSNKVVMCAHRRIKTASIKKCFPEPFNLGFSGPVLPPMSLVDSCGNIEKHCPFLPSWVKSAAKLLNSGEVTKDWNALALELGYKQNQINRFNDDLNPGLVLLADWIISSGNTGLSVDMLTVYLEKLDRDDIVEIIQRAQESEQEPPQVFISYQWDCQDEVKILRDRLERSGFTCWMDVGQLGGGDQLYNKIDEAVRNCKVVIACVSPKFVVSQHCMKEMSVADLLRKPIIPVMMEKTIWPPLGGMSLIFSQLVYINMKGVGGHGGTGLHADMNDKYKEIIQRISLYALPDLSRCIDTETDVESKSQYIDNDMTLSSLNDSDTGDRISNNSSMTMSMRQNYAVAMEAVPRPASYRPVETVHVQKCRICVIL